MSDAHEEIRSAKTSSRKMKQRTSARSRPSGLIWCGEVEGSLCFRVMRGNAHPPGGLGGDRLVEEVELDVVVGRVHA